MLADSPLAGKAIGESRLHRDSSVNVITIERAGRGSGTLLAPSDGTKVQVGDVLLVDLFTPNPDVAGLCEKYKFEALPLPGTYFSDRSQEIGMAEVIVSAESPLAGKTLLESRFGSRTSVTVIGLRRGPAANEGGVLDEPLRVGDTLLVVGQWKHIERLGPDDGGVIIMRLPTEVDEVRPVRGWAVHAVVALLIVVGLMVSGIVPNLQAALLGCLIMGLLGWPDMNSAHKSISWKTLVLIVGMLPFSIALQRAGGVDPAAGGLMRVTSGARTHVVLACLFFITAGLGLFISNTATAALMAPVAIQVARDLAGGPLTLSSIRYTTASTPAPRRTRRTDRRKSPPRLATPQTS